MTDEALLAQYVDGDFSAFEKLYARNKGGLYRYLSRQVHNKSLVEDLFQDVWGNVISHRQNYQQSASFRTWLYTIARNKVIDHVRHMQVVEQVIKPNFEDAQQASNSESESDVKLSQNRSQGFNQTREPDKLYNQFRQAQAIDYCMNKLPKHQLDCFLLKEEGGLTAAAIADIVDINLEALKSRLKACYKNLRSCLSLKLELSSTPVKHVIEGKANDRTN
jgi:RNA polymerase sigma-70 factor (ECF subfamily)